MQVLCLALAPEADIPRGGLSLISQKPNKLTKALDKNCDGMHVTSRSSSETVFQHGAGQVASPS